MGFIKVERTVLLKNVARHSKGPLFPNAAIWGERWRAGICLMYLLETELENLIVLLLQ